MACCIAQDGTASVHDLPFIFDDGQEENTSVLPTTADNSVLVGIGFIYSPKNEGF